MFKRRRLGIAGARATGGAILGTEPQKTGNNDPSKLTLEPDSTLDEVNAKDPLGDSPEDPLEDSRGHPPGNHLSQELEKQHKDSKMPQILHQSSDYSPINHSDRQATPEAADPGPTLGAESVAVSAPKPTITRTNAYSAPLKPKNPTIVFDLQPNICKEYYKTGYCNYGDSCKFAHIRDLHPAKAPLAEKATIKVDTTCTICGKDPSKPGKLKCGHRCCIECFLKTKPKKCALCNADTNESITIIN